MTDELLRNTIMKVLFRVDPVPMRRRTLAAECEIAMGTAISKESFDSEIAALRRAKLIGEGRDGILGEEIHFLTVAGQAEARRAFG